MKLANFLNIDDAYDVIKMATLHRTSCDVVWRHKDASTGPHCIKKENLLFTTSYVSFKMQSVCFLVLYQVCPYIGSSGRRYDTYKTDFDSKMSEISNIVCRWVKTMPEILKSRGIHAHGNFFFGVSNILFSCRNQKKGQKVNLTAIIQFDEFNF